MHASSPNMLLTCVQQDSFRIRHSPTILAANGRVISNPVSTGEPSFLYDELTNVSVWYYIGKYVPPTEREENAVVERPLDRYNYNSNAPGCPKFTPGIIMSVGL